MNEEEKKFYPFSISFDEEKIKNRRNLKNEYDFESILALFGGNDSPDAGPLIKNLQEEIDQVNKCFKSADEKGGGQAVKYEGKLNDDSHGLPNMKTAFEDRNDFFLNHEDKYTSYQTELNKINQSIKKIEKELTSLDDGSEKEEKQKEKANLEQEKEKLNQDYKPTIEAKKKFDKAEENINKVLYGDIGLLGNHTPPAVMQSLLKFREDCNKMEQGGQELFKKGYLALFMSSPYGPEYAYKTDSGGNRQELQDEQGRKIIQNEHRFSSDREGRLVHSIRNLKNTGLDITWVGDQLGLAHCADNMTSDQVKALAEYCYDSGVRIDDYFKLKDLKVVDKNKNEIGTAADVLRKEMDRLNAAEKDNGKIRAVSNNNDSSGSLGRFLEPLPEVKPKRSEMVQKAKAAATKKGYRLDCMKTSNGWNSTIISVYADPNDMINDGKMKKDGTRSYTKHLAVELNFTSPPSASFYMKYGLKFEADHARMMLDPFKQAGCRYFILPSLEALGGKEVNAAFMKASVKTGMVPLLKSSPKGIGGDIGAADLETILKETQEEANFKNDSNAKVEYLVRWHQQLERYTDGNPKAAKSLGSLPEQFRQQALFTKFNSSHMEELEKYMYKGKEGKLDGGKWDGIDKITAKIAMARILKEIGEGKVDGKLYNPLADNSKMLQGVLDKYMKDARMGDGTEKNIGVEKEVIRLQEKYKKERDPLRNALQELDKTYNDNLRVACENVGRNGGPEIKKINIPDIAPTIADERRVTGRESENREESQRNKQKMQGWNSQQRVGKQL